MKVSVWHGCYDSSWKGLITPASFVHPAKMARGLLERIFDYGAEQGYWQPGDLILDPFGGILSTGIIGSYRGYRTLSIELEPRFVKLAEANIEKNRSKWERLGCPLPVVVQGDSRDLVALVRQVPEDSVITSPPYEEGLGHTTVYLRLDAKSDAYRAKHGSARRSGYREGIDGVVTSPPYADSMNQERNGIDWTKIKPDYPGRVEHTDRVVLHERH